MLIIGDCLICVSNLIYEDDGEKRGDQFMNLMMKMIDHHHEMMMLFMMITMIVMMIAMMDSAQQITMCALFLSNGFADLAVR